MQRVKRHIELTETGKEFLQQVKILCSTENTINLKYALNKLPLCCNYGSYNLLRSAFEETAIKPHIAFIAATAESAITFTGSGLCVSVVPLLADDALPNNVNRLPSIEATLCFEQMFYN